MKKEIKFEFLLVQVLQYCIEHNIRFIDFIREALKTKLKIVESRRNKKEKENG